jgi:pyruvate formate lyase activating enzyme
VNNGLIFDIRRFSVHDGPGIRTTVFFKGCPLRCWWCHNPESQDESVEETLKTLLLDGKKYSRKEKTGKFMTVGEVMREILRDRVFYEESGGGVTFSGGEPLMQPEFLYSLLEECRRNGVHTAVDTCGSAGNDVFRNILPFTDLFLYDLKIMDDELHRKFTGVSNDRITDNLKNLVRQGKNIMIRFPVIPGITDTRKNINAMKDFLTRIFILETDNSYKDNTDGRIMINLLPYHSMSKRKYERFGKVNRMKDIRDVKKEELSGLKKELEEAGMYVTIGS